MSFARFGAPSTGLSLGRFNRSPTSVHSHPTFRTFPSLSGPVEAVAHHGHGNVHTLRAEVQHQVL